MLISIESEGIKIVIKKELINEIKNVISGIKSLVRIIKSVEFISSDSEINRTFQLLSENIINIQEEDLDIDDLLNLPNGEYSNDNMFVQVDEENITIFIRKENYEQDN